MSRFRRFSSLRAYFWDVWRREYFKRLQARGKWGEAEDNVAVGEIVVVHEDNLHPQKWLIGRVDEVDVVADGKVRVAAVRTANGVFKHPIHKLAPLPIEVADP